MQKKFLLSLASLAFSIACGNQDSINEVQYGLTSAAAVGRAASITMDAIKGTSTVCATVKTGCTTYSCNGAVTVNLGAACPLPLGGDASGSVEVTGMFSSADQATLSQTFAGARINGLNKDLAVASVTQLSSQRSGNIVSVRYTAANATAGASGSALAVGGSATWDVSVDTKGTPDPADDRFTIKVNSASASGGLGTSARVIDVDDVVLDPSCRSNPISGTAEITEVSGFIPKIIKIQFHSTCDGKAEINGSSEDLQLLP